MVSGWRGGKWRVGWWKVVVVEQKIISCHQREMKEVCFIEADLEVTDQRHKLVAQSDR